MKQNKGITLIALVITIVILVILVGVSVSVSINTGLIENSKAAVANYDKAQKDEEKIILDTYFAMNAAEKKIDIDMREGILILAPDWLGDNDGTITLEKALLKLPEGYGIGNEDGEKITNNTNTIGTGMTILDDKDNVVGRIAVLGDIDGNAEVAIEDATVITDLMFDPNAYNDYQDYAKVAMDVNRNGIIDEEDSTYISYFQFGDPLEFPDEGYRGSIDGIVFNF